MSEASRGAVNSSEITSGFTVYLFTSLTIESPPSAPTRRQHQSRCRYQRCNWVFMDRTKRQNIVRAFPTSSRSGTAMHTTCGRKLTRYFFNTRLIHELQNAAAPNHYHHQPNYQQQVSVWASSGSLLNASIDSSTGSALGFPTGKATTSRHGQSQEHGPSGDDFKTSISSSQRRSTNRLPK